MTLKTYHGSCHCGRVRFEADLDLASEASKCNCSICAKTRNWGMLIKPSAFRLLAGADALSVYKMRPDSPANHEFCSHCGVRSFSTGDVPEIGGAFVSVRLNCLGDVGDTELAAVPVKFCDGRANNWWNAPSETRHL